MSGCEENKNEASGSKGADGAAAFVVAPIDDTQPRVFLRISYTRDTTINPSSFPNLVSSIEECQEFIGTKGLLERRSAVVLALGPSGSGKSRLIKGLIGYDVTYLCKIFKVDEDDFQIQSFIWTHLFPGHVCDVVENCGTPINCWSPMNATRSMKWRSTLQKHPYNKLADIYQALKTNGTNLNPESSRFFTVFILSHKKLKLQHIYVDLPGWEPPTVLPTNATRKKTGNQTIDITASNEFISASLLTLFTELQVKSSRKRVNFCTILRTIVASCSGCVIVQCSGTNFNSFGRHMSSLASCLQSVFVGKSASSEMLHRMKSPITILQRKSSQSTTSVAAPIPDIRLVTEEDEVAGNDSDAIQRGAAEPSACSLVASLAGGW